MERERYRMEIIKIPLCLIEQREDLNFKLPSDDKYNYVKIANSIARWGQLKPLLVIRRQERFVLIEGSQILLALRKLGAQSADCLNLGELTDKEVVELACSLNFNSKEDDYIQLAKKVQSEAVSPNQLASLTNLSVAEWESLERILTFNWNCFQKSNPSFNQPQLFGESNDNN